MFLGLLLGTRPSAIGQFFSLLSVTVQKSLRTSTWSSFLLSVYQSIFFFCWFSSICSHILSSASCQCHDLVFFQSWLNVTQPSLFLVIRDLTKPRRRRQRERKKTIGLMSKTTTLHVHHAFLYISLPSLHNNGVKWPNFKFIGNGNGKSKNSTISVRTWARSPLFSSSQNPHR